MKGAILLMLAPAVFAQQGSLEGTAINALTREPLSNVHLRLVAAGFNGITGAYGAMSDRTGHFSIATIRPGTYILFPERAGFLHVQTKSPTAIPNITIKPGEAVTGYQLEMTPRAVISGRVLDEAGDPVQFVRVETVPVKPGATPTLMSPGPYLTTDDRGEFRIAGPAGQYYVQAVNGWMSGGNDRPEKRTDGTTEPAYAATFYPSSLKKDRATVVEAVAGKDVSGLEIRLARQQAGLSISGVVRGIPDGPWRGSVLVQLGESAQRWTSSRSAAPGPDGRFRIDALQPGFYRVSAMYNDGGKTQLVSRTLEGQLENSDIPNLDLELTSGVELSGTLRSEGVPAAKRTVKLEPVLGYMTMNMPMKGGEVDSDGGFRISNIFPGRYRVKVEPSAENAYIKAMEIDGAAMTNGVADLSKVTRGATAKIVLDNNGAQISGRVLDANGEPMQTNLVMIFMARSADEITQAGNGNAQASPDGKYSIKAIAPGKYRIFGIDAFQMAGNVSDGTEMFKKVFERGEEIEFKAGDRIAKDLKVIPPEDPDAKPKK